MPIVADAAARISADMTDFNRDLKAGGEKGVQTLGQQLRGVFSKKNLMVAGVAGGVALAGAITAGLASAAKALIDIERLNAQTASAIRSTGGVANVTQKGVEDLAEGIESLTTIERESVQEGANLLLTFKNIRNEAGAGNDIFDQSTKALVDMSVAMGTDVKSGAIQLGKALNDPIKGIAALNRVGITFSDVQKDMITAMVEAGDVMGAQKVILAELESQFGGSAEAFANTTAGKIARFQNDVGNMFESIIVGAVNVSDALGGMFDNDRMEDNLNAALDSNEQFATDLEGNAKRITEADREAARESGRIWEQYQKDIAILGAKIRTDWDGTAEFIPSAIRDRWDDTRRAAFQMAVEHAKGILDGQNQIKVALAVLTQLQEEEQTRAQRIAYLQGVLSSAELAAGLNDGRPGVSGAARALRGQIIAELAGLGVNAYNSGYSVGSNVAAGIYASSHLADGATSYLASKISRYLPRSEPEVGPLKGITKVGDAIVHSITDGIFGNLGSASNAASALAGALVPGMSMPAMAMAGAVPAGGGVTYQLVLNGVPKTFSSEEQMLDALMDLSAFGEGRLSGG